MTPAHKARTAAAESGFTLLELLVALTLVAMMAVGVWAVLRISIRSWARGTAAIDMNQRYRSTLDMARKQIASMYPLYPEIAPAAEGQASVSALVFRGTPDSLFFVSLNSLHSIESPGLTLVSYEMAQDSDGRARLVEKEERYTGQAPDPGMLSGSPSTPIFENLMQCTFEYYDPGDADTPSQWIEEWDGGALERLPAAIRMTMIAADSQDSAHNRQLIIPIHARAEKQAGMLAVNPFANPNLGRQPGVVRPLPRGRN